MLLLTLARTAQADWVWARQVITGTGTIRAITYGNGAFVAGTSTGYMLTSRDTVNWTVARPTTHAINDIIFGHNRFVAAIDSSSTSKRQILYSSDGSSWIFGRVISSNGSFHSDYPLSVIGTVSGRFIAMGGSGRALASSASGTRWREPLAGRKVPHYAGSVSDLTERGNTYILCSTLAGATIQTSRDGLEWETRFQSSPRGPARGVAAEHGGKHVVCVGENGLTLRSGNASASWNAGSLGSADLLGVAWGSLFVAFSDKVVYSSPTGKTWIQQLRVTHGNDHLRAIAGAGSLYVAGGSNGKNSVIYVSSAVPAPPPTP